jgi:hypothetical protein
MHERRKKPKKITTETLEHFGTSQPPIFPYCREFQLLNYIPWIRGRALPKQFFLIYNYLNYCTFHPTLPLQDRRELP